ncbi:hypothetical protein DFH08DRAFT_796902 [Mycena albidolilacea]|uniref:Uncharacterized protein n=1 Tax=Mycena albidolilacea TaxID=1033008 RepID=A0AAD7AWQ3_9AGAR|nr:hypothetical protein DFH08DRAFT_796902 [Mycena albidolilacea]
MAARGKQKKLHRNKMSAHPRKHGEWKDKGLLSLQANQLKIPLATVLPAWLEDHPEFDVPLEWPEDRAAGEQMEGQKMDRSESDTKDKWVHTQMVPSLEPAKCSSWTQKITVLGMIEMPAQILAGNIPATGDTWQTGALAPSNWHAESNQYIQFHSHNAELLDSWLDRLWKHFKASLQKSDLKWKWNPLGIQSK